MKVILSGGEVEVTKLGLFELDNITPEKVEPFTYTMDVMGQPYEAEFDIYAYDIPPEKPKTPEHKIEEGTNEWGELVDYKLYQAALLHEQKRQDQIVKFYNVTAKYIIENCVSDPNKIKTVEDWKLVYETALVEPLTIEKIAETLDRTYSAKFDGKPLLEALDATKKGSGSYNTIRVWENKLMVEMRMTELEYALLPLDERARKVCVMFVDEIMSYLEVEQQRKENGS